MAENMATYGSAGNPVVMPKLPSLADTLGPGGATATTDSIFKLLQAPQARQTDILPSIQELLLGTQAPAVQAIREGARINRASAQSDAMKRGLTNSDIEAANMTGATAQGEQAVGQLIAQQSSQLAQYIMQAMGMDIQGNREMFVTLAQALGQELGSQREMEMARLEREQASHLAGDANRNALLGAGIGAIGSIAGGGVTRYSDVGLKANIKVLGTVDGLDICKWDWTSRARALGVNLRESVGVLAQQVQEKYPELVGRSGGFKTVNYNGLPLEVRQEIERLKVEA